MHISGFTLVRISGTSRIAFFEQAAVGRAFSRATDCEAAWRSSLRGWSGFEIGFVRSGPAAAHGHQLKVASAGPKWGGWVAGDPAVLEKRALPGRSPDRHLMLARMAAAGSRLSSKVFAVTQRSPQRVVSSYYVRFCALGQLTE